MTPKQILVARAIHGGAMRIPDIAREAALLSRSVQAVLRCLERDGVVCSDAQGNYAITPGAEIRLRSEGVLPAVEPLEFVYLNHRGERAVRRVKPRHLWFGTTEWHPTPQWLLTAFDLDRKAERDFAMNRVQAPMDAPSCPCLYTTPCDPDCTCVKPHMSTGCSRCCSYGSPEQQKANAEHIAKALAAYNPESE